MLHTRSFSHAETYFSELKAGKKTAGSLLQKALRSRKIDSLSVTEFIECLLNTKQTQIFAESSVLGEGSDWNQTELAILGDLSMAMDVEVFDNALHHAPKVHSSPLKALLIYTPGALLRNETGNIPADWAEVTDNKHINYGAYYGLYERRLLPCLLHANESALAQGLKTLITLPGLGCGQFAGKFKGQLGAMLKQVLLDLLTKYAAQLPAVRAIYYDPFDECDNERFEFEHISLLVRPLLKGNEGKGQLCRPADYEDIKGEFRDCSLSSLVAWDHVSWPGNDFYIGSRATDDGVKAAATSTMAVMSSYTGQYNIDSNTYQAPDGYPTWDNVVSRNNISLICHTNLKVY
ncbi:MAG: hypothetical protein ACI8Z9_000435 [Paraglaciecola sp.]